MTKIPFPRLDLRPLCTGFIRRPQSADSSRQGPNDKPPRTEEASQKTSAGRQWQALGRQRVSGS
jgi:hypothetical protein